MRDLRLLPLALAAAALVPVAASAQAARPLPIELGVDAAIQTTDGDGDGDDRVTQVIVPLQRLRVGFFVTPQISLEPTLRYERASFDGRSSSGLDAGIGLLAHVTGVPTGAARTPSLFIRPFAGLTRLSFDSDGGDGDSETQGNVGVGLGVKLPASDRLATRLEAAYRRQFDSDEFPAANVLTFSVGISFHTR